MSNINGCVAGCFGLRLGRGGILRLAEKLLMVACFCAGWTPFGAAQLGCPAPWSNALTVYGMISVDGSGTGSYSNLTQTVDQNSVVAAELVSVIPIAGVCNWHTIPSQGIGTMENRVRINDKMTDTCPTTYTWVGSGEADSGGENTALSVNGAQYTFGSWGGKSGTFTQSGCSGSSATMSLPWGGASSSGGISKTETMPASGAVISGSADYTDSPDDTYGAGLINANWHAEWVFSPAPDDDCDKCKKGDRPLKGSDLSPQGQSLGESVDVVGTPFFLHYESNRAPGHAGVDVAALRDARGLGGWTLSIHHAFEPMLQDYCAGGSCTPYAVIPKAVFFGDGNSRIDADVQASLSLNGNYYIASEDGAEVYVFNAKGFHIQTLRGLTGAVLYTFAYDAQNRLISAKDANGNVTSIQRAANGSPISITSPYGQKTTLAVDANGFLSKITNPAGQAKTLTNGPQGLLATLTDSNGKVYSYQYDALGRLTKHTDPAGGSVSLARTDGTSGYSVKNTSALGRASTYQVAFTSTASQTQQVSTNTWPSGLVATESRTQQNGKTVEAAALPDGTGYGVTLGPDPRWGMQAPVATSENLTQGTLTMNMTGSRTVSLANSANPFSLNTLTDAVTINGRAYSEVYTGATKTLVSKTPAGRLVTAVLDGQERVSSFQRTGLALNTFTYDAKGRLASTVAGGTRTTTFAYDALGNLATETNPLGQLISFTYNPAGQVLTTTLPDSRVVHYAYDANGNLKSITTPSGSAHNYTYSAVNLATAYTPPALAGAGATTYTFNTDRDITKITRPDGHVITYTYDKAGRVSSAVTPTATITYTYNATTGNLATAAVSAGEAITYGYNGPLGTRSTWAGTVAGYVARTFNNNFWVSSQNINGASSIAFTYDNDGLLTKVGALTQAHSAQNGLYTGGTLATTKDTIAYNTFAERTSYTAQFGTPTLYKVTYTRDNLGRITGLTETVGSTTTAYTYAYDKAGRLITVKKGAVVTGSYTYDNNSNRLSATTPSGTVKGTYDTQDRLLTYGTASYNYTGNGEVATKTVSTQTTTYQYDVLGNLIAATLPNGTAITYIVDAEGNRVGKKVNGVVVAGYLYDRGDLVAQLNVNNQVVSQFVYGGGSLSPDYMVSGGVTYRIFSDHLGSPRLVVNSTTGQIVEQINYDEFGNIVSDTNPGFQPFGFAGGLYDQDTKLVRFGVRDYDASTGRWTAKDPLRFNAGDTNLYGYVMNDPLNLVDPSGLAADCPCVEKEKAVKKAVEDMTKSADKRVNDAAQQQADAAAQQADAAAKNAYKTPPPTPPSTTPTPSQAPSWGTQTSRVSLTNVSVNGTFQGQNASVQLNSPMPIPDFVHKIQLPYNWSVPGVQGAKITCEFHWGKFF